MTVFSLKTLTSRTLCMRGISRDIPANMSPPNEHATGSNHSSQGMPSRSRIRKVPRTQLAAPAGVGVHRIIFISVSRAEANPRCVHWNSKPYPVGGPPAGLPNSTRGWCP